MEPELAESWTQASETTYVFKLKKGVRWHHKPPVNGRELIEEDVKYTYERFLTIKGNGNKPRSRWWTRSRRWTGTPSGSRSRSRFAWFLDALAPPVDLGIVAREAVEKFGDLRKPEAAIGTGPWMLERYEPNVGGSFIRHPRIS